jgi:hypothetical protein
VATFRYWSAGMTVADIGANSTTTRSSWQLSSGVTGSVRV